jgi:hypothetical protein
MLFAIRFQQKKCPITSASCLKNYVSHTNKIIESIDMKRILACDFQRPRNDEARLSKPNKYG